MERLTMTVKMQVTEAQALTLQAMFNHWNRLARLGSSRMIGFYVDGDGNFKPHCEYELGDEIPIHKLTEEMAKAAICNPSANAVGGSGDLNFDFDGVAWYLRHKDEVPKPERISLPAPVNEIQLHPVITKQGVTFEEATTSAETESTQVESAQQQSIQPTFYVRDIAGNYTEAVPQPYSISKVR